MGIFLRVCSTWENSKSVFYLGIFLRVCSTWEYFKECVLPSNISICAFYLVIFFRSVFYQGIFLTVCSTQGWEFAHRFSSNLLVFCERESNSDVKKGESFLLLFCNERMSKEQFTLGHKKEKNCQKHTKNTNFSSDSHVFCSYFAQITSKSLTSLALKSN